MKISATLSAVLAMVTVASAHEGCPAKHAKTAVFSDAVSGMTYKMAIPAVEKAPFPLLMSVTGPKNVTWAGFATGGSMIGDPLLVSWPNEKSAVVSTRWATQHAAPALYNETRVSVLRSSGSNATHWTANYLCWEGCSRWVNGSINPLSTNETFGFAASSTPVTIPSDHTSPIAYHNVNHGHFTLDVTKARNDVKEFAELVAALEFE